MTCMYKDPYVIFVFMACWTKMYTNHSYLYFIEVNFVHTMQTQRDVH